MSRFKKIIACLCVVALLSVVVFFRQRLADIESLQVEAQLAGEQLIDVAQDAQFDVEIIVDTSDNRYETERQKCKFFKSIGCQYTNNMEIRCSACELSDPKETARYKATADEVDAFSEKYGQAVRDKKLAPMYVQWVSQDIGHGIFAANEIYCDDFIGVYAGDVRLMEANPDLEDVDYAWDYATKESGGPRLIVDGKYRGNELRFINHGQNPNTKVIHVIVDDTLYICYVAQKNILANQQLTVSYGNDYWSTRNVEPEGLTL